MFFSKDKRILKKMGFVADQQGILNRCIREEGRWKSHLEKTKQFIIKSSGNKKKNIAVVLGSGWLLDVPVEKFTEYFEQVFLIDIYHSKQILHKISKFPNIGIIKTDITGGIIKDTYNLIKSYPKIEGKTLVNELINKNRVFDDLQLTNADFVVSVNLLNQLDILIIDYIKENVKCREEELTNLREYIQKKHIQILPLEKSCLITDYREMLLNKEGQIVVERPLIHAELPSSGFSEEWIWLFDREMTYYQNYITQFRVRAIDF